MKFGKGGVDVAGGGVAAGQNGIVFVASRRPIAGGSRRYYSKLTDQQESQSEGEKTT